VGDEVPVNLGGTTPRRLLVDWANGQDGWIRELTAETILSRQPPSEDLLDAAYATFLAEKGLSSTWPSEIPQLKLAPVEAAEEDALELVTLSEVSGVNALADDQRLEFDPELTILFGQNGAGKTGYARVLKRISAVRNPEDILPNANTAYLDAPPSPSARIAYRISGEDREVKWKNEAGLAPFTRISVFDARAVSLHVDSELGYVYTPAELALFASVAIGIQGIQQRISAEVSRLAPGSNPLMSKFARGTTVYPLIETLGATTDLGDLEAAAALSDDAEERHGVLQSEVSALRSNTLDALVSNAQHLQRNLTGLSEVLNRLGGFDADRYEIARARMLEAEAGRTEAREELFRPDELPGQPNEDWQKISLLPVRPTADS
jgi:hypothetical protein